MINQTLIPKALPQLICVDDDMTSLKAIERLLALDFEIRSYSSTEDFVRDLDKYPGHLSDRFARVAIVLADHRLPGASGVELLARIQTLWPNVIRVMFSGQIELKEMAEAINQSRIHRFIYKPWDNDYLRIQMLESLALHRELIEKQKLENFSFTDALTGLKNRRYFQERLAGEVERSIRHGRALSLIMIDIDHFKKVNDKRGHVVGDTVLKTIAQLFEYQLRAIDTVARYGGEEFCVILPDTMFTDAIKVADRLRLAIQDQTFFVDTKGPGDITISLGVASVSENAIKTNELIERADSALYQAKRQGRNQSVGAI